MPEEFRPNVESIARRVARYTGMDISFVQSGGNVIFHFGKEPPFQTSDFIIACGARTTTDVATNALVRADIYINHNRVFPFVPGCIVEEFVQGVTALHNDSDEVFEPIGSIFRNTYESDDLADTDITLIRASAHPDIKSGMTRQQVAPIIRRVLAELL